MYFGAVCPWPLFLNQPKPPTTITPDATIPLYRLIPLGILILLFRRLPVVYAMHWKIRQIEEKQQALFVGFFGPIGVSAVFYLYVSKEFLAEITVPGLGEGEETIRGDAAKLSDTMEVVIWFLAICSIASHPLHLSKNAHLILEQIVHGLSVPLGKLGYHLPRTISNAIESQSRDVDEPAPFHIRQHIADEEQHLRQRRAKRSSKGAPDGTKSPTTRDTTPPRPVFRLGGTPMKLGSDGRDEADAAEESTNGTLQRDSPREDRRASEDVDGVVELRDLDTAARKEGE